MKTAVLALFFSLSAMGSHPEERGEQTAERLRETAHFELLKDSQTLAPFFRPQQHIFSQDYILAGGGDISGGGGAYRVGEKCRIFGSQLIDFADAVPTFLDTFLDAKTERSLIDRKVSVDEALLGISVDAKVKNSKAMKRYFRHLEKWRQNSPLFVGLVLQKIRKIKWFATPLPMVIEFDNQTSGFNFGEYYAKWSSCQKTGKKSFGQWEGVVANYITGRGVVLNGPLWDGLGDLSRPGLLLHEVVRSFQYEELLPIRNGHIHQIVRTVFLKDPEKHQPGALDKLFFDFGPIDSDVKKLKHRLARVGYSALPSLSLACADNLPGSEIFSTEYSSELKRSLHQVGVRIPNGPRRYDFSMFTASLRSISVIRKNIISQNLRNLGTSSHLKIYPWYSGSEMNFSRGDFHALLERYFEQVDRSCPKFVFNMATRSVEPVRSAGELTALHLTVFAILHHLGEAPKHHKPLQFDLPGKIVHKKFVAPLENREASLSEVRKKYDEQLRDKEVYDRARLFVRGKKPIWPNKVIYKRDPARKRAHDLIKDLFKVK